MRQIGWLVPKCCSPHKGLAVLCEGCMREYSERVSIPADRVHKSPLFEENMGEMCQVCHGCERLLHGGKSVFQLVEVQG